MPNYISPFDDMYVRFDGASDLLSRHTGMSTPDGMLEMLAIAMWRGSFNPAPPDRMSPLDPDVRDDPENWLAVPIEQPSAQLDARQRVLKPRPYAFYEAGRDTILSVMYCERLLPGEVDGWHQMLEGGGGQLYMHDKQTAFATLLHMPLRCYSEAAKAYLQTLHIPRRMLQVWLDRRSLDCRGLFVSSGGVQTRGAPEADTPALISSPARRGRPALKAWDMIRHHAVRLSEKDPELQRKQLAGQLYMMALEQYDEADVPSETTILRRLSEFLGD